MFTFQQLKAHNDEVKALNYRPKTCPRCHGSHRNLRPRQVISRLIRFILDRLVHRKVVLVILWTCSACHRSFRHLPPFLKPHKRFVTPTITQKASEVLTEKRKPYRKTAVNPRPNQTPILYDGQNMSGSKLSHNSVWRWVQWMGAFMADLKSNHPVMAKDQPDEAFEFSSLQAREPEYRKNLYLGRELWLAQVLV